MTRTIVDRNLLDRQVSLGVCAGLKDRHIARALAVPESRVAVTRWRILARAGMCSSLEFAITQNAAVRERVWP